MRVGRRGKVDVCVRLLVRCGEVDCCEIVGGVVWREVSDLWRGGKADIGVAGSRT